MSPPATWLTFCGLGVARVISQHQRRRDGGKAMMHGKPSGLGERQEERQREEGTICFVCANETPDGETHVAGVVFGVGVSVG